MRGSRRWAPADLPGQGMKVNPKPLLALSQPAIGTAFKLWFDNPLNAAALAIGFGPVHAPVLSLSPPLGCGTGSWSYTNLPIIVGYSCPTPGAFALGIPYNTSLIANTVVLQGLTLQPGNCLALTDALHAVFQRP